MNRWTCMCGISLVVVLSSGCSKVEPPAPQAIDAYKGREETKKLQAADVVGYDGTAVRKSVDTMLNSNDKHNQTINQEGKSAP